MLRKSDGLFREVVEATAQEYPDLGYEQYIVDDFARRLVASPSQFDVVVMPNLYGDILSDVAAGAIGGLGLAPSGCYGDTYAYFESVHGSAPDIAGRNIINPTATLLSAALLLDYLGWAGEARRLEDAIAQVYAGRRDPAARPGRVRLNNNVLRCGPKRTLWIKVRRLLRCLRGNLSRGFAPGALHNNHIWPLTRTVRLPAAGEDCWAGLRPRSSRHRLSCCSRSFEFTHSSNGVSYR